MATVPTQITWVVGQIVTAAQLNSNIRDAVNYFLTPPLAVLRQSVGQSLISGWTTLLYDTEEIDRDNGHSTSSNTSRYTAQTAGWYDCIGYASTVNNNVGQRGVKLMVNGSDKTGRTTFGPPTNGDAWAGAAVGSVFLNVGDYLEVWVYQTSGGSLGTRLVSDIAPSMTVRWVSS